MKRVLSGTMFGLGILVAMHFGNTLNYILGDFPTLNQFLAYGLSFTITLVGAMIMALEIVKGSRHNA